MSLPDREYFRYLTVTGRDRQWGLYATGGGEQLFASPSAGKTHPAPYRFRWEEGRVLPEYAAVFFAQGRGEFESEASVKKTLTAGDIFLLFPGVWHRYRADKGTPRTCCWVTFNGAYAKHLLRREFISPENPVLPVGFDDAILSSYRRLLDRLRSDPPGIQQLLAANIMEILGASLAATQAHQALGGTGALVQQARLLLRQNTEEVVDMRKLAASLGLGYDNFRRVFKEQIGLAPHQYHLQLRIARAKELLHATDNTVKQIAATLNFKDPYHFSKIFKKRTGVSPRQWRGNACEKDSLRHP